MANELGGAHFQTQFKFASVILKETNRMEFLTFITEINATAMDRLRSTVKARGGVVPTYYAFVVKAVSLALRKHPHLNCIVREIPFFTRPVPIKEITANLGVEREMDGTSVVFAPIIRHADQQSLETITNRLRSFAQQPPQSIPEMASLLHGLRLCRWSPGLLRLMALVIRSSVRLWQRMRGGSFVVTSPGKYGGCDFLVPPWPWPLTFAFSHVATRPVVVGDRVVAQKTMRLTSAVDRRLTAGAPFARFTECLRQLLEHPEEWADVEVPVNQVAEDSVKRPEKIREGSLV